MKKPILGLILVVLLCLAFGCQNEAEKAELEKFRAQAKLDEENKALVSRLYEALNKKDFGALKELLAPDYVYYSPSNSTKPHSLAEFLEALKEFHTVAFPDTNFSVEELIASGNKVVSRWIIKGTNRGEFEGLPATGKRIETSGIMIIRAENGKIVEHREDWDMLGLLTQLGMELRPKGPA